MTITAKIIEDSISPGDRRLTTYVLRYPRFIHSEINTHRSISKNASSSRAIPVKKMIEMVEMDPAMPVWWGRNQAGMQANEELGPEEKEDAIREWLLARDHAVTRVKVMSDLGVHKQIANRILEPWLHITVIATATDWTNFFSLRLHKDAQPEFQELARQMARVYLRSTPKPLSPGEWHLPYVTQEEKDQYPLDQLRKLSTARCTRVSYLNHDGSDPLVEKDVVLHDKQVVQYPPHISPTEHLATPSFDPNDRQGNFIGWIPYRKCLPGETIKTFPWDDDPELLESLMMEVLV